MNLYIYKIKKFTLFSHNTKLKKLTFKNNLKKIMFKIY